MFGKWKAFWAEERGVTTVEYALLVCLVAIGAIAAWAALGSAVRGSIVAMANVISSPPGS
jgi:Flp pilus assembly pilin Flp